MHIVHIDDSETYLKVLGDMFRSGFESPGLLFDSRPNCDLLKEELSGNRQLADVYILDNEIHADRGGQLASQIYDRGIQSGEKVLVVSLLCSSLESVERDFGNSLRERRIPVFNKLEDASLCGFYVARNIRRGKIPWDAYVAEQRIQLTPSNHDRSARHSIDAGMITAITRNAGSLYMDPSTFVEHYKDRLRRYMEDSEVSMMESMYPNPSMGKENRS